MAKFAIVNETGIVINIVEASEEYGNSNQWIYCDGFSITIGNTYDVSTNTFYTGAIEIIKVPGLDPNSIINSFRDLFETNATLTVENIALKESNDINVATIEMIMTEILPSIMVN